MPTGFFYPRVSHKEREARALLGTALSGERRHVNLRPSCTPRLRVGNYHGTIVMQRERSSAIASLILLPLLFWGAKVLICIGTGREPHWLFMTVAMLGVLAVSAFFLDRVFAFSARHYLLALSGIYLLGPSMMIMCNTFTGGGVHTLQGRDFWWIPVFSVFPPYTLIMSSYDLTLVPLTISTLWLAGLAAYKWRLKNVIHGPAPAVPPSN